MKKEYKVFTESSRELMEILEKESNITWVSGKKPTETEPLGDFIGIEYNADNKMAYSSFGIYASHGYEAVTNGRFIEIAKELFSKEKPIEERLYEYIAIVTQRDKNGEIFSGQKNLMQSKNIDVDRVQELINLERNK